MPKKTPTETTASTAAPVAPSAAPTDAPSRTPRRARRSSRVARRDGLATSPQLARIEHLLREAVDTALHLAHEHATSAPERACIRRVHGAFRSSSRAVALEFEDLAVTADALLRAFEQQLGPIDPRVSALLIHEIASALSTPRRQARVRVRRVTPPRRAARAIPFPSPFPSFDGERFYGLA